MALLKIDIPSPDDPTFKAFFKGCEFSEDLYFSLIFSINVKIQYFTWQKIICSRSKKDFQISQVWLTGFQSYPYLVFSAFCNRFHQDQEQSLQLDGYTQ